MYFLQYHSENQKWLVDSAIRMICVFALDRFADFVSDQVDNSMALAMCRLDVGVSGPWERGD